MYSESKESSDEGSFDSTDPLQEETLLVKNQQAIRKPTFLTYQSACWAIFNFFLFFGGLVLLRLSSRDAHHKCSPKAIETYSPVYDRMQVKWEEHVFNNSFWPDRIPSIYQLRPSPEVDEAWDRIADTAGIKISSEELRKMGKDPRTVWPWPGEEDAYLGLPDVFHKLHCLDSMRRAIFPEYYGNLREIYRESRFPFEVHLLHCQRMLLETLTCNADLEIVTFSKIKGFHGPFPDFTNTRQCKNWDEILTWKEENVIVVENRTEFDQTPPGIIELDDVGLAVPFPMRP